MRQGSQNVFYFLLSSPNFLNCAAISMFYYFSHSLGKTYLLLCKKSSPFSLSLFSSTMITKSPAVSLRIRRQKEQRLSKVLEMLVLPIFVKINTLVFFCEIYGKCRSMRIFSRYAKSWKLKFRQFFCSLIEPGASQTWWKPFILGAVERLSVIICRTFNFLEERKKVWGAKTRNHLPFLLFSPEETKMKLPEWID